VVRGGWTEGERIQRMLSWGKTVLERKKLECKSFLSYVFKDISFPPECDDRIKIKTLFSIISPPSTQILFSFSLDIVSDLTRLTIPIRSRSLPYPQPKGHLDVDAVPERRISPMGYYHA